MLKFINLFKKTYRLIFLPIILLVVIFFLLIVPLVDGSIIQFVLSPWGLSLLLMVISVIYIEHIFTTPKDALINSLNALIISIALWESFRANFWIALVFSVLTLLSGILFLVVYNKHTKIVFLSKFSSRLGKASVIFPIIALLSFIGINYTNGSLIISSKGEIFYLLIFYIIFIFLTDRRIVEKIRNLPSYIVNILHHESVGFVKANLVPNILLVEFEKNSEVKINDLVVVGDYDVNGNGFVVTDDVEKNTGLVIDFIGTKSEKDTYTARVYLLDEPQQNLSSDKNGLIKIDQECRRVDNPGSFVEDVGSEKIDHAWNRREDIVALITSHSNINVLKGEIVRQQQLENAQLVSCVNKDVKELIRYQIIDAETRRDTQDDRRDFGYTQFMAYQLGEWRKPKDENNKERTDEFQRFFEFPWVPNINSLIYKWSDEHDMVSDDASVNKKGYYLLGTIPNTNLPIYLNIKDLVSHHTAILGVTGTGKTTMVFKLLEEIKKNDIFTICIDITGEYKNKLNNHEDFFDENTKNKWDEEVQKIINAQKDRQKTQVDKDTIERASSAEINKVIKSRIETMRKTKKVVILEIPEISNTHFSLDFTQYAIQAILQYAKDIYVENLKKDEPEQDNFQCCLILEEAHTLVPENLGVGGDFGASKAVIDKISQIALQGRKYNVGFILISQRTATVKKTVLNQCNTMIAFRAYDETSFTFLSNYFGDDYVREIIHLKNDGDSRYVIVSGKAVVADRPIIVEVKK